MSAVAPQEFVLVIDFINIKRQSQLIFDCQTVQPQLVNSMQKTDKNQIMNISQSAHMQQIWNKDLQIL
ncbi:unnamed protein product, partial [Rotaria magnacalcarata]